MINFIKTIVIILLISPKFAFAQFTNDRYHIKDSLKKYGVSSYKIYEINEEGKDSTLNEILYFDKNGNVIKEENPKYEITLIYKYDSLQRLIEYFDYCPGIQNETTFYYYEGSKLFKEIRKDSTGFVNQIKEYFYEGDRLIKESLFSVYKSRNKTVEKEFYYEYDRTGLKETMKSSDNKLQVEQLKNEFGGIIYYKMTLSSGNAPPEVYFGYDKNLRIEQYHFLNGNKIVTEKMIYDSKGLINEIQSCNQPYEIDCVVSYRFYYEY